MQIPNLFQQRAALFYTPSQNIPDGLIGQGTLDIKLPLSVPTIQESSEIIAYRTPRLWVDLMQRATGKVRWHPFHPARVTIITYDSYIYPVTAPFPKALIDALKVQTSGRRDGQWLYYFGAIQDDGYEDIESSLYQAKVENPNQAHCRIIVEAIPSNEAFSLTHTQSVLSSEFEPQNTT